MARKLLRVEAEDAKVSGHAVRARRRDIHEGPKLPDVMLTIEMEVR
jgi:hypothetical protein